MKLPKKFPFFILAIIIACAGVFAGFKFFENDQFFKISKSMEIYGKVYKEIAINYVDELDPEKFMHSGLDGMLDGLDPYTNFIAEDEREEVDLITTGKYGGIGISIGLRDDHLTITSLMDGYSAQRQGLQPGDRILEIDGKKLDGMKPGEVRPLTRGEVGTELHMKVERDGEKEPLTFVLMREEIQLKNVTYVDYIGNDSGIGYIKLERFTRSAADEVRLAIKELKLKGNLQGLILDLRDNPGGLLDAATNIVEKFVPANNVIVTTRGRKPESERKYTSSEEPMLPDVPMAVLVNKNSASASEIVAGALQDLDRAVIIGTRSFGKGLVQTIIPIAYGAQLKMTTAKYYTPSGRCIQEIDYMANDKTGMFKVMPDSLRKIFKTVHGRPVYERGGIMPDSVVPDIEQTALIRELVRRSMFFRFAGKYASSKKDSTLAADNALIKEFDTFLDSVHFTFQNDAEKKLTELDSLATSAKYGQTVLEDIKKLKTKLANENNFEIERNKKEILHYLKREIMARYKGEKGRIAASLLDDVQMETAKHLLTDSREYKKILTVAEAETK